MKRRSACKYIDYKEKITPLQRRMAKAMVWLVKAPWVKR